MAASGSLADARGAQVRSLLERGIKFLDKGKPANALRAFEDVIAADPSNAEAFCQRGNALSDLGQIAEAIASYDRAIALDPHMADAHDFRGVALAQAGHLQPGLQSVEHALLIAPDNFNALNNRANLLRDLSRNEEALEAFNAVIEREPGFPAARRMRALTLASLGRHEEALSDFERTAALEPQNVEALCNKGTALVFLNRLGEAIETFRHALAIRPDHVEALANLGDALAREKRYAEAEACYRRGIELAPDHIEARLSLGLLLSLQRRFDEAGRCYQQVLSVDLNNRRALHGLARAMTEFGQHQSALICYDHLLSFAPEDALAHQKRGQVMINLSNHEEAIRAFDKASALDPNLGLPATRLYAAMHQSRWAGFEEQLGRIRQAVAEERNDTMAFPLLALADDPALQLESSRILAVNHPQFSVFSPGVRYARRDRIRIGYFSADFHYHATMQLFAETLEAHDRDRFELAAFWFGEDRGDAWKARAAASFDHFVDVRLKDDKAAAELAREMEIDIAIDLKGFTHNCRFGILAERAAPIQAAYLGYPGTSGSDCIDYLIADRTLIHPDYRGFISEKIAYLPGCYQANAALGPVSSDATQRDAGLPEEAFVFCCFNQNYKITPEVFAMWMRILRRVDSSVLWLWVDREDARGNLSRHAQDAGIDPQRLIFARSEPTARHLDRLQLGDLFLDTFPCNAHTTASDALRAGLPLLTRTGKTFASRVAASLLLAVDLPELVIDNFAAYEALAVDLANDRARLDAIRTRLLENRVTSTLFDPGAMARKLEAAYVGMYERHHAGEAPADFHVMV